MFYLPNATILLRHGLSTDIKWGASSRWSFHPNFTWGSEETINGNTHPISLFDENIFENPSKKIKEAKENRQPDGPIELTCTKMFPKRLIKVF